MKIELTFDCNDLPTVSSFWAQALGCEGNEFCLAEEPAD
jgi:hypothetical protein